MAVCFNDIIKQGYVRMKSRNLGLWQRRWIILHRASSKGPNRLEKFLDEKAARNGHPSKIMILSDVSNIVRLPADQRKYALCIRFNDDAKKEFACDSGESMGRFWGEVSCFGTLRPGLIKLRG